MKLGLKTVEFEKQDSDWFGQLQVKFIHLLKKYSRKIRGSEKDCRNC